MAECSSPPFSAVPVYLGRRYNTRYLVRSVDVSADIARKCEAGSSLAGSRWRMTILHRPQRRSVSVMIKI